MTRYKNTELFFFFLSSQNIRFLLSKSLFVITVKWVHFIAKSKFNDTKFLKSKKYIIFNFELAFNLKLVKSCISDVNNDVH